MTVERQSVKRREARRHVLTGPDGATTQARDLHAGRAGPLARARRQSNRNGLYRADDGEHVALVNVGPENPLEFQEVVSTTEKLRPLAEATGGSVRRLAARPDDADRRAPGRST